MRSVFLVLSSHTTGVSAHESVNTMQSSLLERIQWRGLLSHEPPYVNAPSGSKEVNYEAIQLPYSAVGSTRKWIHNKSSPFAGAALSISPHLLPFIAYILRVDRRSKFCIVESSILQPNERLLLPPIRPADINKKCLIVDLDETLVHSSFKVCFVAKSH